MGGLFGHALVELGLTLGLVEPFLDGLEVGEREFDLDDAEVFERIGRARDVVVDERSQHEDDGVDLADVGEELVAEAFSLAGAFDEAADVDDLDLRVDGLLRLRHRRQLVEAVVGHLGHTDVRVLRGERVRRGERTTAGQRVVQRALARVGETDESETFHEPPEATERGGTRRWSCSSQRIWSRQLRPDPLKTHRDRVRRFRRHPGDESRGSVVAHRSSAARIRRRSPSAGS